MIYICNVNVLNKYITPFSIQYSGPKRLCQRVSKLSEANSSSLDESVDCCYQSNDKNHGRWWGRVSDPSKTSQSHLKG